jgi:dihydroorotate dehydrogenase (NAD+) catalytic subunit
MVLFLWLRRSFLTDLSVTLAGIRLKNPVIAASGTFGYGCTAFWGVDIPGGICTKALTLKPRAGNGGIRLWETPAGLLNSIGLQNPGIEAFLTDELPRLRSLEAVIIANLSGGSIEEYERGAALLNNADIDIVELNISCPNVKEGGMTFGLEPEAAAPVVRAARKALSAKPLVVKLSPNAPDIAAIARACIDKGADALSLVNTFKGMAIDVKKRRVVFNNIFAGLSGPAIKPLALRMVWELCRQFPTVPIVGMGGIANTEDALEFLMAGAAAVEVGSASFANPYAIPDIVQGLRGYMEREGLSGIADLALG